jgi:hypothetical protein
MVKARDPRKELIPPPQLRVVISFWRARSQKISRKGNVLLLYVSSVIDSARSEMITLHLGGVHLRCRKAFFMPHDYRYKVMHMKQGCAVTFRETAMSAF